jgi:hypothetical protein
MATIKFTEEGKHAVDQGRGKHHDLFEGLEVDSPPFYEALSRWAKEYPEEISPYKHAIGSEEKSFPLELLLHWEQIEFFSKEYPGVPIEQLIPKWLEGNPFKGEEKGKAGFGTDIPAGARD